MNTQFQLIVFVNPKKFGRLVGDDTIPNFRVLERGKYKYLNNSESVVYVAPDRVPGVGVCSQVECDGASVVLVPDKIPPAKFVYRPVRHFKILYHGQTLPERIQILRASSVFRGELKSSESVNTPYERLARAIKSETLARDLPEILEDIPFFDPVLEAKLELFQATVNGQQPRAEVLSLLKQVCPEFEAEFESFTKAATGDLLSDERALAFTRLRNVLNIE